ncbi:unnamed protein product [Rhodiola kirilowii]
MKEDETIADFNTIVLDIANESFALGEPICEERLVRKVLRSLPQQFAMKAVAIKEAQDVKTMRLDELMGSLRTSEQQYAMLAKNLEKFMKRLNNGKGIQCRECKGYGHIQAECANTRKKKKAYVVN